MRIGQLMTRDVKTCREYDSLNVPAQIMSGHGYGAVPVVDDDFRVIGFLTDRDICMAAVAQGRPLHGLNVGSTMARKVISCTPEDDVGMAAELMRENRICRLPVTDRQGILVGIISLDDIACEAMRKHHGTVKQKICTEVADTLGAICEARAQARALMAG
jgi:CBS domain-containing protein